MAETATIPAPAAPAAPAKPTVKEINVSEMQPTRTMNAPRPGSARAAIQAELQKKAGIVPPTPPAQQPPPKPDPKPQTPPPKPAAAKPPEPAASDDENLLEIDPPGTTAEPPEPAAEEAAAAPAAEVDKPKTGKESPWKIVDKYKERLTKAESELADLRSKIGNPADAEKTKSTLTALEKRNKELEDEIRYVNYEKSTEYKEKYEVPYKSAWERATAELGEIAVKDNQTGEPRAATTDDLLTLVNLPLGQARAIANEVFGEFADDMMAHRKEIRTLFDAQRKALAEAREKGSEREAQTNEQRRAMQEEIKNFTVAAWNKENENLLNNPAVGQFFKEREGDQEWNDALKKGYKLVDQAFNENPNDPRLTPRQRAEVVKRHAAFRHRAAGWGPLKRAYDKQIAKIAELEGKLKTLEDTSPSTDGGQPTNQVTTTGGGGKVRDQIVQKLHQIAKP